MSVFDLAVLGAGPAGANAALEAAAAGCRVVLLDEQQHPGGEVWRAKSAAILAAPATPESRDGDNLRHSVARSTIAHRGDSRVWQIQRDGPGWRLHAVADRTSFEITARALLVASGAREYVQPVPGWTLPGVIGLAGATAYLKENLRPPGRSTIVAGPGPLAFYAANEIHRLGGDVRVVMTPNARGDWLRALPSMVRRPDLLARGARWLSTLAAKRIPILWQHSVTRIEPRGELLQVQAERVMRDGSPAGAAQLFNADCLCLGNGLVPSTEIPELLGLPLRHEPRLGGWVPEAAPDGGTSISGLFVCGDGAGVRGAAAAELQGRAAGLAAVRFLGAELDPRRRESLLKQLRRAERFGLAMTKLGLPRTGLDALTLPETVVCRCEDVTRDEIEREIAAGAATANAVKSGTRCGMGPCGGRFCQTAVARIIERAHSLPPGSVSPPTARPPLRPVPIAALSGTFRYKTLPIPAPAPL